MYLDVLNERGRKHDSEMSVSKKSLLWTKQLYSRYRNKSSYLKNDTIEELFIKMINITQIGRKAFFIKYRSSFLEVFLGKYVLKIRSKSTGEHPSQSVNWMCNFIEITLKHGPCAVHLLCNFRTSFPRSTSGGLLLKMHVISNASEILQNGNNWV